VVRLDLYVDYHTYTHENNIGYSHYDIGSSYKSAQDCRDHCDDLPNCVGVVHRWQNNWCEPKTLMHSSYRYGHSWYDTWHKQKEAVWPNSELFIHNAL
jgi:hypothetical protein